jgi:hypothetical protein
MGGLAKKREMPARFLALTGISLGLAMEKVTDELRLERRKKFIERFARQQEIERRFVRLSEAMEFDATEENGIEIDEEKHLNNYIEFIDFVLEREPEDWGLGLLTAAPDVRPSEYKLLCLRERREALRIDYERLALLQKHCSDEELITKYLYYCWLPTSLMTRWCDHHGLKVSAAWRRAGTRATAGPSQKLLMELEESESKHRSAEQKREAIKKLFDETYWPLPRALRWIAFRDPALIAQPLWSPTIQSNAPAKIVCDPHQALFDALRQGQIAPYLRKEKIDPSWIPQGEKGQRNYSGCLA